MKYLFMVCICLSAVVIPAQAQPPVKIKLIGAFKDSLGIITYDTLWIGMQADGRAGFQEGLDIEDTASIKRWGTKDTLAPGKYLKTNIQAFNFNTFTLIQLYLHPDIIYIKWDTNEFNMNKYSNRFDYFSIGLMSVNLELGSHENYGYFISGRHDYYPNSNGINPIDSVINYSRGYGRVWVTFGVNCNENLGKCEAEVNKLLVLGYDVNIRTCRIWPSGMGPLNIRVFNISGQEVLHIPYAENKDPIHISFEGLAPALYYVVVNNNSQTQCKTIFAY